VSNISNLSNSEKSELDVEATPHGDAEMSERRIKLVEKFINRVYVVQSHTSTTDVISSFVSSKQSR
jgi:hypothetical protein